MPDATQVVLIRHAHVALGPPPGILCGSLDLPLSSRGCAQLRTLRTRSLHGGRPHALYASTLRRARDTAATLADLWNLEPHFDAALREIHCGVLEGRSLREIERDYPHVWATNLAQADDDFSWPGGESYSAFRRRVSTALAGIAAKHPGQRIAVVTHAGVIAQVIGILRSRPAAVWDADRPDVLSLTEIVWMNGAPTALLAFNRREWG